MSKHRWRQGLTALIAVFITVNSTMVYAENQEAAAWQSKVDPYLLSQMQATDQKLPVWLWMEDIDQEEVEQEVYQRTGLNESNLSVIAEPLPQPLAAEVANLAAEAEASSEVKAEFRAYLSRTAPARAVEAQRVDAYLEEMRAVQSEMLTEQNAATFAQLNIPEEDVILTETLAPVYIVMLDAEDIERLAKHPGVTAIYFYDMETPAQADFSWTPELSSSQITGTLNATTLGRIRTDVGLTGSGVKLGIIDGGMVQAHSEIPSSRITYITPTGQSDNTHATNVARIAAGSNGVAPAASIYSSYGVVIGDNDLQPTNNNMINAITNQCEAGVQVANYSQKYDRYHDQTPSDEKIYVFNDASEQYLDYIVRTKKMTFVVAAGNERGVIHCPGVAYNIITVGGLINNDTSDPDDDYMYTRTSYDNGDGCFKPDLIADQPGDGTSYAAPVVTGTVALLYQLRPALKTQPEAVKAILLASCHRKAVVDTEYNEDSYEYMTDGLTDHQGAGVFDPYRAIAIAGSGHYGYRTMGSTQTEESIRFQQPAYDSEGLNVSLAWSSPGNTSPTANLNLRLYRGSTLLKSSNLANSSTEMVYVTPSNTSTNYTINVKRQSATGQSVRYAYAFSVDHTRYQYTGITEGVFYLKNKATDKYLTLSGSNMVQQAFSNTSSKRWLLGLNWMAATTSGDKRLAIGSTIGGNYKRAVTAETGWASVMFQWHQTNYERDGSITIYNGANAYGLGIYNNSTASGTAAAWSPYSSSNTYQQWYLEPVAYQRGDVNVDGVISSTDGNIVLQYTVGTKTFSALEEYLADVNGDGNINANDALMINQISGGVIW